MTPASGASLHRRLREAGHSLTPFRRLAGWAIAGLAAVTALGLAPLAEPAWADDAQRISTLAALVFFLAAPGLWFRMGRRAVIIATVIVLLLYATTAIMQTYRPLGISNPVADLFVVAVITSFLVFALAGFNLVFVGEEMIYDAHRLLHLRHPAWHTLPLALSGVVAVAIPVLERKMGLVLPNLWLAAVAALAMLCVWWVARAFRRLPELVLRELHLFAFALLLVGLIVDGIHYLQEASELVPSVVALLVLLGTWVYVSYTTLQRAHFLLRASNAAPWLAILLAASFAIVAHANSLYSLEGHVAVESLVGQRLAYMAIGVAGGLAFLVGRSVVRGLRLLRAALGARGKRVARRLERVPASLETAQRLMGDATFAALRGMDEALPGAHRVPERPVRAPADDEALPPAQDEQAAAP